MDMLKKSLRLKTKKDFERVFREGTPLFFGVIACKIVQNKFGHIRLGFSFSKRHFTKAVSRNRLRRVLSEPFSRNLSQKQNSPAVDVAFFTIKKESRGELGSFASVAESVVKYINQ